MRPGDRSAPLEILEVVTADTGRVRKRVQGGPRHGVWVSSWGPYDDTDPDTWPDRIEPRAYKRYT